MRSLPGDDAVNRTLIGAAAAAFLAAAALPGRPPGGPPSLERVGGDSAWTRSGERVFFFRDVPYRGRALFSIRLEGQGEEQLLAPPVEEFVISGDGRKIAYSRPLAEQARRALQGRPAPGECGVLELEGPRATVVTPHCWEAMWDPGSRYLAYQPGNQNLYVFDTRTRRSRKVGEAEGEMAGARWAPDGSRLYFLDRLTRSAFEIDLASGRQRRLAQPAAWKPCPAGLDPSEGRLRFRAAAPPPPPRSEALSPSGTRRLRVVEGSLLLSDAGGGSETVLLRNTSGFDVSLGEAGFENPVWTADERYALGEYRGRILVVEIATGRAGVVARGRRPAVWMPRSPSHRVVETAPSYHGGPRMSFQ